MRFGRLPDKLFNCLRNFVRTKTDFYPIMVAGAPYSSFLPRLCKTANETKLQISLKSFQGAWILQNVIEIIRRLAAMKKVIRTKLTCF